MAERFGSQVHPSGGQRFGSQTYTALSGTVVGALQATEAGADVFSADSYPRINGTLGATESGSDTLAGSVHVSLSDTMQAHEAPTPDTFIAAGGITDPATGDSLRFGSQEHPLGGLRFGSAAWAALGPNGPMAAAETGADTAAALGWLADAAYSFAAFDVLASFVDYGSESLGAAITGALETGYKVMLPVAAPGISLAWELNAFGNPSLRLANLTGTTSLSNVPWYVWDGSTWTSALFDVSDAMQGAVFMVEAGADTFSANGSQTRYGSVSLTEADSDFVEFRGGVRATGSMAAIEPSDSDAFAAAGAPSYEGSIALLEGDPDVMDSDGAVAIEGPLAATEIGSDVFAGTAASSITGELAAFESGADAFASVGRVTIGGAVAVTEQPTADLLAASGTIRVQGLCLVAEAGADGFEALGGIERLGAISMTETGHDTAALIGHVPVTGALNTVEEVDRFDAVGFRSFEGDFIAAEVDALEGGADRFLARGIGRDLPVVPDFDGKMSEISGSKRFTVRSKQLAAIT